jgi:hypothetical protein
VTAPSFAQRGAGGEAGLPAPGDRRRGRSHLSPGDRAGIRSMGAQGGRGARLKVQASAREGRNALGIGEKPFFLLLVKFLRKRGCGCLLYSVDSPSPAALRC